MTKLAHDPVLFFAARHCQSKQTPGIRNNRLIHLVTYTGVALLKRLLDADITGRKYPSELCLSQLKIIADRVGSEAVYLIMISAVNAKSYASAADALGNFSSWDDELIFAEAHG